MLSNTSSPAVCRPFFTGKLKYVDTAGRIEKFQSKFAAGTYTSVQKPAAKVAKKRKPGEVVIPAGTGIFGNGFTAYMKDTSTVTVSGPAKALVTDRGDVIIAVSHLGKGTVLGVVDPWFYNEYADGRKMGQYRGFEAAQDVAAWAIRQAR